MSGWYRRLRWTAWLVFLCMSHAGCKAESRHWEGGEPRLLQSNDEAKPLKASEVDFAEFPPKSKPANLLVPVWWKQDPHGDRSWRARLHTWNWIWPLLTDFHQTRDEGSFRAALDIAEDWIAQNQRGRDNLSEFAWSDTSVAFRAEALGYLLRAGVEAGLLDSATRQLLLKSAIEHGQLLSEQRFYTERHNHGLYQDLGLTHLCLQLNKLADCQAWKQLALQRFKKNLSSAVDAKTGMHLEHSPHYHLLVIPLVDKMSRASGDAELARIAKQLRQGAAWLAPPDNRKLIVGDTPHYRLPDWVVRDAKQLSGLSSIDSSGYAVVKKSDSYLFAIAAFHSDVHKHRDDASFVWYEAGRPLITDTGKYAYRFDSKRDFALSARAHNTLMVDDQEFELEEPYGSGIIATAEREGWYAIVAENPLLRRQHVTHKRIWLYRPAKALVVLDQVESQRPHLYDRYFHFWHELELRPAKHGGYRLKLAKRRVHVRDVSPDIEVQASVIWDSREPLQGIMFPHGTKPRPNDVLKLSAVASNALFATSFAFEASEKIGVSVGERGYRIDTPGAAIELALGTAGIQLDISKPAPVPPGAEPSNGVR